MNNCSKPTFAPPHAFSYLILKTARYGKYPHCHIGYAEAWMPGITQ